MSARRRTDAPIWSLPLGSPDDGETLQRWLYRTLRQAILDGRLGPGARLPGTRALARQQALARGTVQAAYDQLLSEGYLDAARGSATRVAATLPERSLQAPAAHDGPPAPARPEPAPPPAAWWTGRLDGLGAAFPLQPAPGGAPPFHPHRCDVAAFPVDTWRRLHVRHLRPGRPDVFGDTGPAGLAALRQAIAAHLHVARGVAVPPEQIVVLGSVQQALDICLRLLVGPGETVWMEDPGYAGARQLMLASGARVADVPVDADGMRVEDGLRAAPHARLAYVTPARQAPLGMALAPQRRLALLDWAVANDAYVFEDDYDSEYRFVAKPIPALRSHPGSERHVILAGTFSKLLFPGIRLAFVALPRHLVDRFVRAFSLTNRGAGGLAQAVLADFMAEGHFDRHVRRMRRLYAARAAAFEDAARRHWHGLLEVPAPQAGLDVVARLVGMDEDTALARLAPAGLTGFPLRRYCGSARPAPGLVMGFAPFDADAIEDGARRIARALSGRGA
ncbi:PLP-dependent aminotransferase family protein [uncultured Massilia sp.]|uniref:MocR-like pyridoxine biosynthesis transcription factor PdxR n=1 Tax=uncultured Massilia sp. TaxID=169973 RepID=UPI0025FFEC18|nr:PLP-dependent aminotransferase family protein [uncultured Massilia sp.]